MLKTAILVVIFLSVHLTYANNLSISNITTNETFSHITFDISWDNHYYYPPLYDYAWVFIMFKNANSDQWHHLDISHATSTDFTVNVTSNECMRIYRTTAPFSGSVNGTITVIRNTPAQTLIYPSFRVFGIEMTRVENLIGVTIGDGASENGFYTAEDSSMTYYIYNNNTNIPVGGFGNLTWTGQSFNGDISSNYPKIPNGVMKYEISQIQYVDFLNCLSRVQQINHVETDVSGTAVTEVFVMSASSTPEFRNGIRCDSMLPASGPVTFYCDVNNNGIPNEADDGQNIACNYLLPENLEAYLDWAGLRPMSEIEYEVICRGNEEPVGGAYAWSTTDVDSAVLNMPGGGPDEVATNAGTLGLTRISLDGPMRCGFAANDTTSRVESGGAFYGAMDMTGNLAEIVGSLNLFGTPDFNRTSYGDGALSDSGYANGVTWAYFYTLRGEGTSLSNVYSVSHRNTENITSSVRSPYVGGRGAGQ